jgi:hypothetical protein
VLGGRQRKRPLRLEGDDSGDAPWIGVRGDDPDLVIVERGTPTHRSRDAVQRLEGVGEDECTRRLPLGGRVEDRGLDHA